MIKKVDAWVTTADGLIFTTLEEAEEHEEMMQKILADVLANRLSSSFRHNSNVRKRLTNKQKGCKIKTV